MFYVYVLRNQTGRYYIGYTSDLKRRLKEHNTGNVYTTKRIGGDWKLVYYECSINQNDALRRERYLKSGRGNCYLKKRLRYQLKKQEKHEAA
jgi:putative endonuclease